MNSDIQTVILVCKKNNMFKAIDDTIAWAKQEPHSIVSEPLDKNIGWGYNEKLVKVTLYFGEPLSK